jgi:hypothetical protein
VGEQNSGVLCLGWLIESTKVMAIMRRHEKGSARLATDRCETLAIGIPGFEECLRQGPNACRYALPFGYGFLCRHPRLAEVSEVKSPPTEAGRTGAKLALRG